MDFWQTFSLYCAMFGGLVFFTLALINFIQGGYFFPFLRVKISNGNRILVRIKGLTQDYFRVGKIEQGDLLFKGDNKQIRRLTLPTGSSCVYRGGGVYYCIVDNEKNAIVKLDFSSASGFDAEKWNNLLERALTKPQIMNTQTQILIFLIVVALIGIVVLGLMVRDVGQKVSALKLLSDSAIEAGKTLTQGGV